MIEVEFVTVHDFIDGSWKIIEKLIDHRLIFQSFCIFTSKLIILNLISVKRGKGIVVDQRDEIAKSRKSNLIIVLYQPHHYLNWSLICNHFNHLLTVDDQIVLIDCLNQHRTQILNYWSTVWRPYFMLIFNLLDDCSHYIQFYRQFLLLRAWSFVYIKVQKQLNSIGNSHMLRMVDEIMENSRLTVNSIDCLLVSIIEQTKVSPEKVSCQ